MIVSYKNTTNFYFALSTKNQEKNVMRNGTCQGGFDKVC